MVSQSLHSQVIDKLNNSIRVAEKHFGITVKMPNVVYQKRGTTAGTANYLKWEIDLNAALLEQNGQTFIDRTVVHELAHLVHHIVCPQDHDRRFGKRDVHGSNWQHVMRVMGGDPSRCHSYDVSTVRQNKTVVRYLHKCSICQQEVETGPKHHNAIEQGQSIYHLTCGRQSRLLSSSSKVLKSSTGVITPTTPNKPSTPTKTPAKGSKIHQCYEMYKTWYQKYTRAEMINIFVQNCDCTPAGASTYYQTCKKMYENDV